MKWAEIGFTQENRRLKVLSEFLKSNDVENEFSFLTTIEDNFVDCLVDAQKKFEVIHVANELGGYDLANEYSYPSRLLSLQIQDVFQKYDGQWLPRNFLLESIRVILAGAGDELDINGGVLIFGSGPSAVAAFGALNFLGFSRFTFVDANNSNLNDVLEKLRRFNFGVDINSASNAMITQLPGIFSVVVNTLDEESESQIIEELSFFNFLANNGIVVSTRLQKEVRFLTEAKNLGAQIVDGYQIFSKLDFMWLNEFLGEVSFQEEEIKDIYLKSI